MKMKHLKNSLSFGNSFKWIVAIAWLVVSIFPIYWLFNVVFSPSGMAASLTPRLFPTSFTAGFTKIAQVADTGSFLHAYLITFYYAIVQILGILLITSLAAYEFALFKFPGKDVLFIVAISAMMVPQAVTLIPLFRMVSSFHWVNTIQGLAFPGMASALSLFIMRQYMEDVPKDLIDAASIDGASHLGTFRYVALPLARNALFTVGTLAFVFAWGNYLWPLMVGTSPSWYTVSVLTAGMSSAHTYNTIDQVIGAFFLASIPPVVVYIFLQRFIINSIALTGLKG